MIMFLLLICPGKLHPSRSKKHPPGAQILEPVWKEKFYWKSQKSFNYHKSSCLEVLFNCAGRTVWIVSVRCSNTFFSYGLWYKSKLCNFTFRRFSPGRELVLSLEFTSIPRNSISCEEVITDFFSFITSYISCNRRVTVSRYIWTFSAVLPI